MGATEKVAPRPIWEMPAPAIELSGVGDAAAQGVAREQTAQPSHKVETLPRHLQMLYAMGQMGWASLANLVGLQLVYFYLPPKDDETGQPFFPTFITQDTFIVVFNIIAILATVGRLWDAVTDPLIATFSDRLDHPRGRRIPCLAVGGAPAALFCALMFFPLVGEESVWNIVWLAFTQFFFYFFLTVYCTPYFSLVAELGHSAEERLNLSTWISITYALGTVLASGAPALGGVFGLDNKGSLQAGIVIICIFACICMYIPVVFIEERRFCCAQPSQVGVVEAIKHCLRNPHFRPYVAADFCYFFAVALIMTGLPYYLTVLVQLEADLQFAIVLTIMSVSFALYVPTNLAARKFGKKKPMLLALGIMVVVFAIIYILGREWVPLSPAAQIFGIGFVTAVPLAVLGVLPNAVLADIAAHDALMSGESHEGMYFAAKALLSKLGQSVAILVFASLTNFGKDVGDDLGIRLSGPVGMVFAFISCISFSFYEEEKVLKEVSFCRTASSSSGLGGAAEPNVLGRPAEDGNGHTAADDTVRDGEAPNAAPPDADQGKRVTADQSEEPKTTSLPGVRSHAPLEGSMQAVDQQNGSASCPREAAEEDTRICANPEDPEQEQRDETCMQCGSNFGCGMLRSPWPAKPQGSKVVPALSPLSAGNKANAASVVADPSEGTAPAGFAMGAAAHVY